MSKRTFWHAKGNTSFDHPDKNSKDTYDALFDHFSAKPTPKPLSLLASNSLVVGQEFILTCFLLASHRVALSAASNGNQRDRKMIFEDQFTNSLFLLWATFILVVWLNRSQPGMSRKKKLKYRTTDAIFMGIFLRFLAAVLKTLTASYSSDTVQALAICTLFLHLLACDYSYANGFSEDSEQDIISDKRPTFQGGTLSLTAAFFATILLASRLEDNLIVYTFVSSSVILFALYPAARHQVAINTGDQKRWVPTLITTSMLTVATFLLLYPFEQIIAACTLFLLCAVVPCWTYCLQASKRVLRGPWDIAHV